MHLEADSAAKRTDTIPTAERIRGYIPDSACPFPQQEQTLQRSSVGEALPRATMPTRGPAEVGTTDVSEVEAASETTKIELLHHLGSYGRVFFEKLCFFAKTG